MNAMEQIAALFTAVQTGETELIDDILREHPELANTENNDGLTPLGFAAHFGRKDAVLCLLEHGADINALSHSKIAFIPSNTALHAAIAGNAPEVASIVELLVQKGADVNAIDSNGHSPIQAAAFEGNMEIARLLLEHGADLSINSGRGSALSIATGKGNADFAELLRQRGAKE